MKINNLTASIHDLFAIADRVAAGGKNDPSGGSNVIGWHVSTLIEEGYVLMKMISY